MQVTSSQLSSQFSPVSLLVLAESEEEKKKWVRVLESLQNILTKNQLKSQQVHILHEAYDASLPLIKTALCAAVLGQYRPRSEPLSSADLMSRFFFSRVVDFSTC